MSDLSVFSRLLAPIARRIRLMTARAVITLIDDAAKLQGVQVKLLADEVGDKVERFQNYGFTSHPKPGAEGIYLALGGDRGHGVLVVVDDRRYRLHLEEGEVAMYSDEGDSVIFKRGRSIEVTAGTKVKATAPTVEIVASTKVTMTTPLCEMSGNLAVAGDITGANITVQGNVADQGGAKTMAGMRSTYNGHTHPENNTPGGSTGNPSAGM